MRGVASLRKRPGGTVQQTVRHVEVLVVDHEVAILAMLKCMLTKGGIVVRVAQSGEQALEIFEANRDTISVVLLDVQFPRLTGPEILVRLRELDKKVPVVFMTGGGNLLSKDDLKALGAVEVLAKPFSSVQAVADLVNQLSAGP
jgi:DNA-binding response OmpR family regulator